MTKKNWNLSQKLGFNRSLTNKPGWPLWRDHHVRLRTQKSLSKPGHFWRLPTLNLKKMKRVFFSDVGLRYQPTKKLIGLTIHFQLRCLQNTRRPGRNRLRKQPNQIKVLKKSNSRLVNITRELTFWNLRNSKLRAHLHISSKMPSSMLHRRLIEASSNFSRPCANFSMKLRWQQF